MALLGQTSSTYWELSLSDILLALKRGWVVILATTLIGLFAGLTLTRVHQSGKLYAAITSVAPYGRDTHWAATMGVTDGTAINRVSVAVELEVLISNEFAKKVGKQLIHSPQAKQLSPTERKEFDEIVRALPENPSLLTKYLNAFLRTGSHIFDIEARAEHASVATMIANVAARTYVEDRSEVSDLIVEKVEKLIHSDLLLLEERLLSLDQNRVSATASEILEDQLIPSWRAPLAAFQAGSMTYAEFRNSMWLLVSRLDETPSEQLVPASQIRYSLETMQAVLQNYLHALPLVLPRADQGGWLVSEATLSNTFQVNDAKNGLGNGFLIVTVLTGLILGLCFVLLRYLWSPKILSYEQQSGFSRIAAFGRVAINERGTFSSVEIKRLRSEILLRLETKKSTCILLSSSQVEQKAMSDLGQYLGESFAKINKPTLILSFLPDNTLPSSQMSVFDHVDTGTVPDATALQEFSSHLSFLSRGSDTRDPLDAFALPQFANFIKSAGNQYEIIIMIAPCEAETLADGLLCKHADIAAIVTRQGKTTLGNLAQSIAMLSRVNPRELGSVMLE